ncbi:peroxiredoxin Q/BCP [Streptosporangium becharense]|uniref:thioredoxin-dependent peroxiredoxin n=1 Tax=Streptosporangium becharense TaxID=1816182 RepID=A0A7W9IDP1_9ACTN|nr:peroxiredoxin [Streptosporangium becharense]MBB2912258.1 peroxiredoxin Q/BCP [Streptosporangium becharense]MBB5818805.1 peroxiredoxin Q/BCP [Streptosporangium becharense]
MGVSLAVGDVVGDFELLDETGTPRRLTDFLAKGPVVLFFYPAAMTSGCTAESCHFRNLAADFAEVGASRIGISRDRVERQARFAESNQLGFPLLSDPDGTVARRFGARRAIAVGPFLTRRMTFVIDVDRSILAVIHSESAMEAHADRALEVLRSRPYP